MWLLWRKGNDFNAVEILSIDINRHINCITCKTSTNEILVIPRHILEDCDSIFLLSEEMARNILDNILAELHFDLKNQKEVQHGNGNNK